MPTGRSAAYGPNTAEAVDQRLTLILSLFRLYQAVEPDAAILDRLVDEVRQAETDGGDPGSGTLDPSSRRTALCVAIVQRFITTNADVGVRP